MSAPSSPVAVKVLPHGEGLGLPAYATEFAAGCDLPAAVPADAPLTLPPGDRALVPTGVMRALRPGFEAQVRPRSGLALRYGVTVLNAPGTVDADNRGEVMVLLVNLGAAGVGAGDTGALFRDRRPRCHRAGGGRLRIDRNWWIRVRPPQRMKRLASSISKVKPYAPPRFSKKSFILVKKPDASGCVLCEDSASNSVKSSRCRRVKFCGVSTVAWM